MVTLFCDMLAPISSTFEAKRDVVVSKSLSFNVSQRPSFSPSKGFDVLPPYTDMELSMKRPLFSMVALMSPLPAPNRKISMKIPHATAKPVSAVRSLLRLAVDHISAITSLIGSCCFVVFPSFHYAVHAEGACMVVEILLNATD